MTTAIDTNVFVALWNEHDTLNSSAVNALGRVYRESRLSICSPVFAELLAALGRTGHMLDSRMQACELTGTLTNRSGGQPRRPMPRTPVIAAGQQGRRAVFWRISSSVLMPPLADIGS